MILHPPRPRPRRRRQTRQQGYVMLVVMMVLLVATATATIAVEGTAAELRAAGQDRQAAQTEQIAMAGLMTTLAYIDMTAVSGDLLRIRNAYKFPATPPIMGVFAEPNLTYDTTTGRGGTRHDAFRFNSLTQRQMFLIPAQEASGVITEAQPPSGTTGNAFVDEYGSLGPNQAYTPFDQDASAYVADVTDCVKVKGNRAGQDIGGTQQSNNVNLVCNVIVRARTELPVVPGSSFDPRREWGLTDWAVNERYQQNPFSTVHEARAAVELPTMLTN